MKKLIDKIKNWFLIILPLLLIIAALTLGIWFEIYRWHTFQEVTHSDIGYWKWQFLFNSRHK